MKNKSLEFHEIHIPNSCRQPRSHGPRRRTDFSDFISSSRQGSVIDFSNCKDGSSGITTASMDQGHHAPFFRHNKERPKLPLVRCIMSQDGGNKALFLNSVQVPLTKVEFIAQNASFDTCDNGNTGEHKNDCVSTHSTTEPLPFSPNKSTFQVAENGGSWIAPGSVVWAKTDHRVWWPAEVMDERAALSSTSSQSVDGLVLVQFYGNHKYAWVDPVGDLCHFDDCFEERSCNRMNAFQDALKQALHKKDHISSCKESDKSPDLLNSSFPQSPDKCNASSSSRTEDDYHEEGRGKRKRTPKVHFDELTFPMKSVKKVRRLRIMRYLGLKAPAGSPFSLSSH
ncbi:uncharacterized protein LOC143859347 [Tasmannia lanceolata]|uniref:uncharacterized protein LOC143859347 n=1 Tax=Tasmannia lanceolata TaxID=3420 RepID=UPI0040642A4B